MKSRSDKNPVPKSNAAANKPAEPQPAVNSSSILAQHQLQEVVNNSPQVKQLKILQAMANRHASGKTPSVPRESWHVVQRKARNVNEVTDAVVQHISGGLAKSSYFQPANGANKRPHLNPGAGTVQRATLQIPTVDYDPKHDIKYDFDVDQEKTTAILTEANKIANTALKKIYKQPVTNTFNALSNDAGKQIISADVPTLAADVAADVLGRYNIENPKLGPLPPPEKGIVTIAIKTALNDFMKDRIFGHGLTSDKEKGKFNKLITVSTTKSQNKGATNVISQAALNGIDANANNAATAIDAAFTNLHAVNPPGIGKVARGKQYKTDLATLPAAGRDAHHNVAGWLPALPRPATAPWMAPTLDHKRSSVVAWALTQGAPSLYLEFNGGQIASRIVYDPMNGISYASMHYTSIGGYNPFFKII
ncbi:hypothetical protein [uncultured Chitinophaga sp.]|jgi:Archaeal DNA polymerase II, small subunit/DNA polymerase delta, subunit B|uniref:hypothetical protein n=1 Tax=uncultured Chitinophaga sp. TaxID=339340 RepID=UPI0026199603|nr:hypothetical protein [uncultured Chitinophaga sp.]